jgi:hypothetical protein
MSGQEQSNGLSRRAVLGGIGAGAGLGVLGAGLHGGVAGASPMTMGRGGPASIAAALQEQATALKPSLRYILFCGHDFAPLESPSAYSTLDGQFHFTGAQSGYASVLPNLPLGSVIKELEMYGSRTAAGTVSLDLWKSTVADGTVALTAQTIVPAAAGVFTATAACNDTQDDKFKSTPFVNIDAAAAPTTLIFGMRVGYVSPTGFVPLPTSTPPRVYDSRLPGGSKLAPNEERTITLPVPAAIGSAVFTLTITETEGTGGFVAAFQSGISWPGNSSVNWYGPDQNVANTVVCAVSSDSKIILRGGANKTHVIVDVAGWIA